MKTTVRGKYPPEIVLDFFQDEVAGIRVHNKTDFIQELGRLVDYQEIQFSNPNNPKCKMKAYFNTWNQYGHDFKPPQASWTSFDAFVAYLYDFSGTDEAEKYIMEKYNLSMADILFGSYHRGETKKPKDRIDQLPVERTTIFSAKTVQIEDNFKRLDDGSKEAQPFLNYFRKNHYPEEQITNCYYCTENIWHDDPAKRKMFKNRLILTFREGGRIVHYSGRYLYYKEDGKIPKWLHCTGSETHKFVGNIDTRAKEVMLCETAKNAWKVDEHGIFGQGTNFSDEQINKIKLKGFDLVVICLDNDENYDAGPRHAWELYQRMLEEEIPVKLFNWKKFCQDRGKYINDLGEIPVNKIDFEILRPYFISGLEAKLVYAPPQV